MTNNKQTYFFPIYQEKSFNCPHCNINAEQLWSKIETQTSRFNNYLNTFASNFQNWSSSFCSCCEEICFWAGTELIYPRIMLVEEANSDLNDDIKKDYLEASKILQDSPRASAALLRLALQKLCKQLGCAGKDINKDIGILVSKGLNSNIQKAMDTLRIIGNNAVHPGEINLDEDIEIVKKLFSLLNFIANAMITEPNKIQMLYDNLPKNKKKGVDNRDK